MPIFLGVWTMAHRPTDPSPLAPPVGRGRVQRLLTRYARAPRLLRAGAGIACAAAATALAATVQNAFLPRPSMAPFVFFFFAVACVGWLAGMGAGLLTVLLAAATANSLYLEPYGTLSFAGDELRATVLFVVGATPIAVLSGLFRRALLGAHRSRRQLSEQAALCEEAARAARASEARFRELADAMPQLVWTARPDGTVDYYNRRAAEYAGITRHADGSWAWSPVLHPDDVRPTQAAWRRALETGGEYRVEHRVRLAGGGYRWHLSRGVPFRDASGAIVKWYGTATDIHDQKRTQVALQEADRRKSEFLGVLSHELRNPLAPMRNSLFIAARAEPGSAPSRRALAVIDRQVRQLTRLVDDLLDVTRISRGKIQLRRESVDLRTLAQQSFDDHESLFAHHELRLELALPEQPLLVWADAARLRQIIGNLLQNAAKFAPGRARTLLAVRAASEQLAEIVVEDTGPGIPPEVVDTLFDPFVQAERTMERSGGGLGLGLALVKGLAELHGGTVRAENVGAGTGARFVVGIPRERRRAPRPGGLPARASIERQPRRVLVIEDNSDAAETLKEALELEGHAVELAYSGVEGLRKARDFRPEVVVCDLGLPGMNGFEVARTLRASADLGSATLIALSGYALADDVDRARAAGFDLHVAKPPDIAVLERSILEAPRR